MEPQTLLATLHEHFPSQVTGQHDIDHRGAARYATDHRGAARYATDRLSESEVMLPSGSRRDDIAGVIITVLALIGIMLAVAALDGSTAPVPPSTPAHFMR